MKFSCCFSTEKGKKQFPVPDDIPGHTILWKFSRASGPGGQNVNKVNSKASLRLFIEQAFWIEEPVRNRIMIQQASNIRQCKDTGLHELSITRAEHRTQEGNRRACLERLCEMVRDAISEEKRQSEGPSLEQQEHVKRLAEAFKERRMQEKQYQKAKKQSRSMVTRFRDTED